MYSRCGLQRLGGKGGTFSQAVATLRSALSPRRSQVTGGRRGLREVGASWLGSRSCRSPRARGSTASRAATGGQGLGVEGAQRVDRASPSGGGQGSRGRGERQGARAQPADPAAACRHAPTSHSAGPLHLETPHSRGVMSLQVTRDSRTYSVGVCTAAAGLDQGGCKDGSVCLLSGSKGVSFGRLASMRLDYRHQDEAVILSYANGDNCPPGKSLQGGEFYVPRKRESRPGGRRELRSDAVGAAQTVARSILTALGVSAQALELLVALWPGGLAVPTLAEGDHFYGESLFEVTAPGKAQPTWC